MEKKTTNAQNPLLQLELLKKLDLSDTEIRILDILAYDILAYDIRATSWETASEAASYLDALCPPLEQRKEAEGYFYLIWSLITDIATSHDVTKETQTHLINTLSALQQCAKGEIDIWGVSVFRWSMSTQNWAKMTDHFKLDRTKKRDSAFGKTCHCFTWPLRLL